MWRELALKMATIDASSSIEDASHDSQGDMTGQETTKIRKSGLHDLLRMDRKDKARYESEDQARTRFQVELEFVQCLANPNYLNFLAQRGYFKDSSFVNYLKYLQYWKEAKYAKFLKYPQCLHMLELLQYEHFRKELVNSQCAKFIEDQQLLNWQHYHKKRNTMLQEQAEKTQAGRESKEAPRDPKTAPAGSGT